MTSDAATCPSCLRLGRRHALLGLAATGLVVSGCASDTEPTPGDGATGTTNSGSPSAGETTTGGSSGGISTADVPVGGGLTTGPDDDPVVITQPTAGEFKAFSAICTHQGCTVNRVEDNTIKCPCHGSEFSAEDGSNTAGPRGSEPNLQPLEERPITVEGDTVTLG